MFAKGFTYASAKKSLRKPITVMSCIREICLALEFQICLLLIQITKKGIFR
jgi:hypothetical protein